MTRFTTALGAALVATAMLSVPLYAQTNPPATPPATTTTPPPAAPATEPSTVDKIKKMSKSEWSKLRASWTKNKEKYASCRDKAKTDGLKGTKRWAAIYDCMTAQ